MDPSRNPYAAVHPAYIGAETVRMGPAALPPTPRLPTVSLPGATAYLSPPSTPRSFQSAPGALPPSPAQQPAPLSTPPHRATVPPYPPYPSPRATPTSFQIHAALLYTEALPHRTPPAPPCVWNAAQPPSSSNLPPAALARAASQPALTHVHLTADVLPGARIAVQGSGPSGVLLVADFLAGLHQLLHEAPAPGERLPPQCRRRIDALGGRTRFLGFSAHPHAARTFVAHFA